MGRRPTDTTKGGKAMNPTDAFRKQQRRQEIKKNKKQRALVRDNSIKMRDPKLLYRDIYQLKMLQKKGTLNTDTRVKKMEETLGKVAEVYEEEAPKRYEEYLAWKETFEAEMVQKEFQERQQEIEEDEAELREATEMAEMLEMENDDEDDDDDDDDDVPLPDDGDVAEIPLPRQPTPGGSGPSAPPPLLGQGGPPMGRGVAPPVMPWNRPTGPAGPYGQQMGPVPGSFPPYGQPMRPPGALPGGFRGPNGPGMGRGRGAAPIPLGRGGGSHGNSALGRVPTPYDRDQRRQQREEQDPFLKDLPQEEKMAQSVPPAARSFNPTRPAINPAPSPHGPITTPGKAPAPQKATTLSAAPQVRDKKAMLTKMVPAALRVKRTTKPKPTARRRIGGPAARVKEAAAGPKTNSTGDATTGSKDAAYADFMSSMSHLM